MKCAVKSVKVGDRHIEAAQVVTMIIAVEEGLAADLHTIEIVAQDTIGKDYLAADLDPIPAHVPRIDITAAQPLTVMHNLCLPFVMTLHLKIFILSAFFLFFILIT